jgi:hypothetical protein
MKRQGNLTHDNVKNQTTKKLMDSEGNETSMYKFKRMIIRNINEIKKDMKKQVNEIKENMNKELSEFNEKAK